MIRIAMRMIFGARGRYATLVLGLAFAVMLCTQQVAILLGVLQRSTGPLQNIGVGDLWVVSRETVSIDFLRNMHERELMGVRSVAGVEWAEPLLVFKGVFNMPDGAFYNMNLIGIDRSSRIGKPPTVLSGDLANLDLPDTVFMEVSGRKSLPGFGIGDVVSIGRRRARVIGTCRARAGLDGRTTFYTSVENLRRFAPAFERSVSVILVKVRPTSAIDSVARAIGGMPEIVALRADDFRWMSMKHLMLRTGIGLNFAFTAMLGFVVGVVLATVGFHQFASDNLPYFALLRAAGARNSALAGIVLVQALVVGIIGYGIGIGLAALATMPALLALDTSLCARFPLPLVFFGMLPMFVCACAGSLINLHRVLSVDPAVLFQ
jgi:putative ABC transport system permease protein